MEPTNLASRAIVQELLTIDNYKRWKTLMKNYLVGKNLWAIVESDSVCVCRTGSEEAQKKNAEALHIIQLSCEPRILDEISHFARAKDAWQRLGSLYDSEINARLDIEQGSCVKYATTIGLVEDLIPHDDRILHWHLKKGEWSAAEAIISSRLEHYLDWVGNPSGRTVLHIATIAGHVNVVGGILRILQSDQFVRKRDSEGYTALALAAHYTGNVDVAKCMKQNICAGLLQELLAIPPNGSTDIPLLLAADKGHRGMTRYLYSITTTPLKRSTRGLLLQRCIKAEIFDVALKLLKSEPNLPSECLSDGCSALAQTPTAFLSACQFGCLQKFIYNCLVRKAGYSEEECRETCLGRWCKLALNFLLLLVKPLGIRKICEQKRTHYQVQQILKCFQRCAADNDNYSQLNTVSVYDAMLNAAKHGIIEFIDAMREVNPDLLWVKDRYNRGIFSYAILHRRHNVFQLMHTLSGRNDILKYGKDVFGNNLLHLAACFGPSSYLSQKSGAALQMQREIQWFKNFEHLISVQAVEKVVHPKCKEEKNNDEKKPHELFTEMHQELVEAGEKWIRETFNSFTLVGTLITAIMFAAAITVPGGNNQETGVPIFLNVKLFTVFLVADAISVFTSASSVVIFIVILTSRFTKNNFLNSLPWKLLCGVFFLCLSVVSMMVAFCAALAIILKQNMEFMQLLIAAIIFCCILVMVLVRSQVSITWEICRSNPIIFKKDE